MYDEIHKKTARTEVLQSAIKSLTANRNHSTLTTKNHVRKVKEHLLDNDDYFKKTYKDLKIDNAIKAWESLYDSIIATKKTQDLKVGYLSGPNPENDLKELIEHGVLQENIWAFESESRTYDEAISSLIANDYPFIKLVKSNIADFFETSSQKFDILYLDFCGPLPSRDKKNKTLLTVTKLLSKKVLNSPGVLITNFSFPNKQQNEESHNFTNNLVKTYLYPKPFLESKDDLEVTNGAMVKGFSPDDWGNEIESQPSFYYGQFITRLLIDLIQYISPYSNLPKTGTVFESLFDCKRSKVDNDIDLFINMNNSGNGGLVSCEPDTYPILWSINELKNLSNSSEVNKTEKTFIKTFLNQLNNKNSLDVLFKDLSKMVYLLSEEREVENYYSEKLLKVSKKNFFNEYYHFCDVFLFHQVKELLIRQVSVPYHVNIENTKRWQYKAKDTEMFMDMIIVDECRYLYDWLPTVATIDYCLESPDRQFILRFILDGISQHRRYFNTELFYGTACIGECKEFRPKILKPRKKI